MKNKELDLATFCEHRLHLIRELEAGKIDKCQYIHDSLEFYHAQDIQEPQRICSLEEGLYYYQYYNSLAKSEQIKYRELVETDLFAAIDCRTRSSQYYKIKDRISLKMLKLLKNKEVCAYYLETDSSKLNRKLVEIVVLGREKVILHTLSKRIIHYIDKRGWLATKAQCSIIEEYVNKKYYNI